MNKESEKYPVKVDNETYGPIPVERLISDVKSGELTNEAKFWDGEDWVPVTLLLDETERKEEVNLWNDDNWSNEPSEGITENGGFETEDLGLLMEGEPRTGGIPMKKLLNVTFRETNKGVTIIASSFHKMYEVYSLKCQVSKPDSKEILKELKDADVRIINKYEFS